MGGNGNVSTCPFVTNLKKRDWLISAGFRGIGVRARWETWETWETFRLTYAGAKG